MYDDLTNSQAELAALLDEEERAFSEKVEVCDCEHKSHFDFDNGIDHVYGEESKTTPVKTPYGTFHLCATCKGRGHCNV